jgi:hypothetical protein
VLLLKEMKAGAAEMAQEDVHRRNRQAAVWHDKYMLWRTEARTKPVSFSGGGGLKKKYKTTASVYPSYHKMWRQFAASTNGDNIGRGGIYTVNVPGKVPYATFRARIYDDDNQSYTEATGNEVAVDWEWDCSTVNLTEYVTQFFLSRKSNKVGADSSTGVKVSSINGMQSALSELWFDCKFGTKFQHMLANENRVPLWASNPTVATAIKMHVGKQGEPPTSLSYLPTFALAFLSYLISRLYLHPFLILIFRPTYAPSHVRTCLPFLPSHV